MAPLGVPEIVWRLGAFALIFAGMALAELAAPRLERPEMLRALKARRWVTNIAMVVVSSLLLRLVFPLAAVGTALYAQAHGYGLFPALGMSPVVAGILSFLILDFAIWLEHLASHKIRWLWRFHRMHHADTGFDVTTALRFHPVEILISIVWKAAIIIALGAPALAVLIFEIVLNGAAMFNHANLKLPARVDGLLRRLIVTPDMHSIHHSAAPDETDTNYGFNLSLWDRLFSTYRERSKLSPEAMRIGLAQYPNPSPARLFWSLLLPFRKAD